MTARLILMAALLALFACNQQKGPKPEGASGSSPVVAAEETKDPDTIANEKIIRAFADAFNGGDVDAAAAAFAEKGINHGSEVTRADMKAILTDIKTRFPDAHFNIMMTVSEGEWVVVRAMYGGTHNGVGKLPIDGGLLTGVPPTGKAFDVQVIHMFRLRNGEIIEHWANRDDLGMMQQLGLLPQKPPTNWQAGATSFTPVPASTAPAAQ